MKYHSASNPQSFEFQLQSMIAYVSCFCSTRPVSMSNLNVCVCLSPRIRSWIGQAAARFALKVSKLFTNSSSAEQGWHPFLSFSVKSIEFQSYHNTKGIHLKWLLECLDVLACCNSQQLTRCAFLTFHCKSFLYWWNWKGIDHPPCYWVHEYILSTTSLVGYVIQVSEGFVEVIYLCVFTMFCLNSNLDMHYDSHDMTVLYQFQYCQHSVNNSNWNVNPNKHHSSPMHAVQYDIYPKY